MSEKNNIISIDGKEYNQSDLSEEQIRLATKVARWQKQTLDLKDAFEDANILQQQYLEKLKTSLSNDETMKTMEDSKAG